MLCRANSSPATFSERELIEIHTLHGADTWPGAFYFSMMRSTGLKLLEDWPSFHEDEAYIGLQKMIMEEAYIEQIEEMIIEEAYIEQIEEMIIEEAYIEQIEEMIMQEAYIQQIEEMIMEEAYIEQMEEMISEDFLLMEYVPSSSEDVQVRTCEIQEEDEDDIESPQNRDSTSSDHVSISSTLRLTNEDEILAKDSESLSTIDVSPSARRPSTALASPGHSDVESQTRLTSVVASSLLAVFGGLTIGYTSNVTGGTIAMDGFEVKFSRAIYKKAQKATTNNFCSYINFKLLLFTSTMQISAIPSAWVAHALIESWGRKPVLVIGSVLPLVGSAIVVWFPNNIVASLGLAIIGCSGAFLNQVIPIICEEINVGDARKRISRIFNFMVLCGSTITNVVNMVAAHDLLSGWRWSFASCGLLAFPLIPLSIFLSETPRFLIKKGRMDEAKVALGRIRRNGVEAELHDLVGSIEREDKMKWKRLRRSPHLMVNIASQILQRFVGLDSILFLGPMLLQSIGYSYHASFLAPLIASIVRTIVAGFTCWAYTFFGRRRTLISTCVGMFLAQVCLLGLFRSRGDRIYHLSRQNSNIAISFVIPLVGLYSLLSGPTDWTGASYPEGTTLMGASLEMTTSLFLTLAMNPLILWLLCVMESWIFALLAACALFLGILIWIFLPERPREKDGESSEEDIWRGHWFWKRFLPETATSGVIEV